MFTIDTTEVSREERKFGITLRAHPPEAILIRDKHLKSDEGK